MKFTMKAALAGAVAVTLTAGASFAQEVTLRCQHFVSPKSAVPFYFAPRREVFVKPTTAKGILALPDVQGVHYQPTPTWEFYRGYRKLIADVAKQVHPSLSPSNAAVSGFLMMSLGTGR